MSAEIDAWDERRSTFSQPVGRFELGAGVRQWCGVDVSWVVGQTLQEGGTEVGFTLQRAEGANSCAIFSKMDGSRFIGTQYAPQLVITSAVPEPQSHGLMGLGLGLLAGRARRRRGFEIKL